MPVSDPSLDKKSVLSPNAQDPATRLPPPGHKRDEQLRMELDELNRRAEEIASQLGIERADPARIKPDHDAQAIAWKLAHPVDPNAEVGIQGLQDGYQYVCVWGDPRGILGNRIFWSYKKDGWETVSKGMPEYDANPDAQRGDGALHFVDTVLMRMDNARHAEMKRKNLALRIAREEGVPLALLEAADRHGAKVSYGELPTDGGSDSIAAQAMRASQQHMAQRRVSPQTNALAMEIAQRKFADALKAGTLHRR